MIERKKHIDYENNEKHRETIVWIVHFGREQFLAPSIFYKIYNADGLAKMKSWIDELKSSHYFPHKLSEALNKVVPNTKTQGEDDPLLNQISNLLVSEIDSALDELNELKK